MYAPANLKNFLFHKALLNDYKQLSRKDPHSNISVQKADVDNSPLLPAERITDVRIPELAIRYHGTCIDKVLLDGGAGVNIITQSACERYGLKDWEPAPFLVRMADQRRVQPVGLLKGIVIDVARLTFAVSLVVLNIADAAKDYNIILGRPWLRQAKIKHNWDSNQLTMWKGRRKVRIHLGNCRQRGQAAAPG